MNPRAPRAISELIVNALPELRERLVEEGIRRSWPAVVGAEGARRSRPQRLTNGLLEIAVDNSPWLHELTPRPFRRAPSDGAALWRRKRSATSTPPSPPSATKRFAIRRVASSPPRDEASSWSRWRRSPPVAPRRGPSL